MILILLFSMIISIGIYLYGYEQASTITAK
jgi:hypothetical protein